MSVVFLQKIQTSVNQYTVNITWDPVDSPVTGYELEINGKIYKSKTNKYTLKNASVGDDQKIRVRACFASGFGEWSEPANFTVKDITAPKAGKLVLKQTDAQTINLAISGDSDNDKTAVYKFFLNGKEIYSGAEKSFDYVNEEMGGKLNFTALVIDASGNVSKEVKSSISVKDMTPPEAVTNIVHNEEASEKSVTLTWTASSDNVGVTGYVVTLNGKKYKTSKNSITIKNPGLGHRTVNIVAMDKAKNESSAVAYTFWAKDATAPKAGKITDIIQYHSQDTFLLAFDGFSDAEEGIAGYNIYVNNTKEAVAYVSGSESAYVYENYHAAGSKITFMVEAVDFEGNKSKQVKKVYTVKDMIAPEKVTGLYVKEHTAKKTVLDWDDAKDNVKTTRYAITVRDAEGNVVTETTSTKSEVSLKDLAAGDYKVVITASDKAGNKKVSNNEITIGAPAVYAMRKPGQASENADDTWANAMEISENDGILAKDFWLCGEELADNSVCGFADSVDYMKFTKTSDHSTLSAWVDSDHEGEVSIELLDASGNTIDTIACWSDYSLEELKNGIYGIKVKVDENTHASGMISVY